MSINYGKNWKKQYVDGKRVENLNIYVDDEKVCVSWDTLSLKDKIKLALKGDLEW